MTGISEVRTVAFALRGALCAALALGSMFAHSQHQRPHARPEADAPQHGAAVPDQSRQHGEHAAVAAESKQFATIGYDDARGPRSVQTKHLPAVTGDPAAGKHLAHDENKGRCLTCHAMDKDGDLPGNVGPDLSTYGTWGARRGVHIPAGVGRARSQF